MKVFAWLKMLKTAKATFAEDVSFVESTSQARNPIVRAMLPRHNPSIAQTLYRVFVCPELQSTQRATRRSLFPRQHRASLSVNRISNTRKPPPERYSHNIDEGIVAPVVRLLSQGKVLDPQPIIVLRSKEGGLLPPQTLASALRALDRTNYFLVQTTKPSNGSSAEDYDLNPPICTIMLKKDFFAAEHAKRKAKGSAEQTKQFELNWAISANDLAHRLRKVADLLTQGRRVEVILAGKKRGRQATLEEANGILRDIRRAVEEVDGAKEWKVMQGSALKECVLYFEGKKSKSKTLEK